MEVLTDNPHKIEELFVRLNSGEAATGAERRNAMAGPIPPIVRDLVLHPFFQKKIRFDTKRMQEFNLATKLLLIETRQGFVDTKARDLDIFAEQAARWAEQNDRPGMDPSLGVYGEARDRIYDTLEKLNAEFLDRDRLLSSQGNIPVYYWVARQHPKMINELHDFLVAFTEKVQNNLVISRLGEPGDQELSTYYTMSRSTNDQASLQGRYDLLMKRFKAFINTRPGVRRRA